jgi:SpoVK/Ycf46/Vps4 family AAA+-type ATPase
LTNTQYQEQITKLQLELASKNTELALKNTQLIQMEVQVVRVQRENAPLRQSERPPSSTSMETEVPLSHALSPKLRRSSSPDELEIIATPPVASPIETLATSQCDFETTLECVQPSDATTLDVSLQDIGGLHDVRDGLKKTIESFKDACQSEDAKPPGILMVGPQGLS